MERDTIVADPNVDQVPIFSPVHDIIAFGSEHSSLDVIVHRAAERMYLAVTQDPLPDPTKADQYKRWRELKKMQAENDMKAASEAQVSQ